MNMLKRFISDERGIETIEWVVMAALIIVALVATIKLLTTQAKTTLNSVTTEMGNV
jgi:Flp pilus assembly pilin Flp